MCRKCISCQAVGQPAPPPPVNRTTLPSGPWEHLAVDLLGPLPSGDSLLVLVDYYSRFFEVDIMRSTSAEMVIERLEAHFSRHGSPRSLRSDNGPQFIASAFQDFLKEHGVTHRRTTSYWPRANGEVKRQNRSLLKILRIAQLEQKPWKSELHRYLTAYRTTPHSATKKPPATLLFNRPVRSKLPAFDLGGDEDTDLRDTDAAAKFRMADYANSRRQPPSRYELQPGDKVLLKKPAMSDKLDTPFDPKPHIIISITGDQVVAESPEGVHRRLNIQFTKPLLHNDDQEEESQPAALTTPNQPDLDESQPDVEESQLVPEAT